MVLTESALWSSLPDTVVRGMARAHSLDSGSPDLGSPKYHCWPHSGGGTPTLGALLIATPHMGERVHSPRAEAVLCTQLPNIQPLGEEGRKDNRWGRLRDG